MRVFDVFQSKNIDELVVWFDKYGTFGGCPWDEWFEENYCGKCEAEIIYSDKTGDVHECAWCELHNKCKHFLDLSNIPDNKQIIEMWLNSECEE